MNSYSLAESERSTAEYKITIHDQDTEAVVHLKEDLTIDGPMEGAVDLVPPEVIGFVLRRLPTDMVLCQLPYTAVFLPGETTFEIKRKLPPTPQVVAVNFITDEACPICGVATDRYDKGLACTKCDWTEEIIDGN